MTFQEVSEEYARQWKIQGDTYRKEDKGKSCINIDYNQLEEMIIAAAKEKYPQFSEKQIRYIYGLAYREYHSTFGDCIFGMDDLCSFMANFPKD